MVAKVTTTLIPSHGACRLDFASDRSLPKDGESRGNPKPKKSSAVSMVTDPFNRKGKNVKVATRALGRT